METYRPRLKPKVADSKNDSKVPEKKEEKVHQRRNNRQRTQLRPMYFQTGVIPQASGSAYVEIDRTKIICSVWGPRASPGAAFSDQGRLWCDFKFAPFALDQRRRRGQDPDERQWSQELTNALSVSIQLDKFPKSVLEAYVLVLESDGGVFAASATCVSLALASAAIELYDLVASCYVAKIGPQIVLDPDESECKASDAYVTLAFMPSLQQVTHSLQDGTAQVADMGQMMELALDGCAKVYSLMKKTLLNKAKRRFERLRLDPDSDILTPLKMPRLGNVANASATASTGKQADNSMQED